MSEKEEPIVCQRCVMDNVANPLSLDQNGICQYCNEFDVTTSHMWKSCLDSGFDAVCRDIKEHSGSSEYDCILGLSGGIDSSYLALRLYDAGLKPLVVHIDAGWNSELSVSNIEKICKFCNFDLHTIVVPWNSVKKLQVAFIRAGVSNIDAVQDHAFFAGLYRYAIKHNVKSVVSGGNIATEAILPKEWHHSAMDASHIRSVANVFKVKIDKNYPMVSFFQYFFYYRYILKMKVFRPLNYIEYDKEKALQELTNRLNYQPYIGNHGESRFTAFFQNYYLPERFKIDKRKAHLSSLINSAQINRATAIELLSEPNIIEKTEKKYILNKLQMSEDLLDEIILQPTKKATAYNTWNKNYHALMSIRKFLEKILGRRIKGYF